jgi:FtsZ-binding cell division protein ZapB
MSSNTYKINKGKKTSNSLFSIIERKLKLDTVFDGGLPSKYLPHTIFLTLIGIFYIGNNHWAEKTIRKIDKIQMEVEELRADYTSLKADYMFASKQSEVARKVKNTGLKESSTPPNKIVLKKGEY